MAGIENLPAVAIYRDSPIRNADENHDAIFLLFGMPFIFDILSGWPEHAAETDRKKCRDDILSRFTSESIRQIVAASRMKAFGEG